MRTVLVNKDGTLCIANVDKPHYHSRQALTKTIANGMCGTDIHIIKKAFKGITEDMYPLMLGHENVGEVVETGSDVKGLHVGDKVLLPFVDSNPDNPDGYGSAWGALSEYCVVNDLQAYSGLTPPEAAFAQQILPADMDAVDGVMLITLGEVLSSVRYFGIPKNKPVVIYGCGPVGLSFIKMMNLSGAAPIIAIARNKAKADHALFHGADYAFNSRECDVVKKIRELFPEGVQNVVDAVGSEEVINEAMGLLCDRGQICCYGVLRQEEIHIDFSKAPYNWRLNFQQFPKKAEEGEAYGQIIRWVREGEICLKDYISDYYSFDDVVQAYDDAMHKKIAKKGIIVF